MLLKLTSPTPVPLIKDLISRGATKFVINDILNILAFIDRFAPKNIPRTDPGCEIIADVAFLIDSSGSIQKEYLAQLQFVQYIISR